MNFNEIGIPTIKLFAIATIITILLFGTNSITEAKRTKRYSTSSARRASKRNCISL